VRINVLSRMEVEAGGAEGADAVISIRGSAVGNEPELATALAQATRGESARLLRMSFDDIGMPEYGHFRGPTMSQIQDAIEFGRSIVGGRHLFDGPSAGPPLIAVHCEHGKSRSAAIALALLADHFGAGHEHDAVNELMRTDVESRMHPNPLVISLADACLFRYGGLDAALAELSPRYVKWRDLWQRIVVDPDAYWEKASRILSQRRHRTSGAPQGS
jgi:predicted protein tyrosine phosphatase